MKARYHTSFFRILPACVLLLLTASVVHAQLWHPVLQVENTNIEIPAGGGQVSLRITYFNAYICYNCYYYTTESYCNCSGGGIDPAPFIQPLSAPLPIDSLQRARLDSLRLIHQSPDSGQIRPMMMAPQNLTYSVGYSELPYMMDIMQGYTKLSYSVVYQSPYYYIRINFPAGMSSSGYLQFNFKNFRDYIYPITCNYTIQYPPLTSGSISYPNSTEMVHNTLPGTISGTAATGGSGSYAYQWQRMINGVVADISGATGVSYNPPPMVTSLSYRRKVTSGNLVAYTDWIHFTVLPYVLPEQEAHVSFFPRDDGSLTIPYLGGNITLQVTDILGSRCPMCGMYQATPPSGQPCTCPGCTQSHPGFPCEEEQHMISFSNLPDIMHISYNGTDLPYTINGLGTIQVNMPAPTSGTGNLRIYFDVFQYTTISAKNISFTRMSPLQAGTIRYTGGSLTVNCRTQFAELCHNDDHVNGSGMVGYQWIRKDIATGTESYVTGPGSTGANYQLSMLNAPTAFCCRITRGNETAYTNWITFSVEEAPLDAGTITPGFRLPLPENNTGLTLTGVGAIGAWCAGYVYQWQQNIDDVATDIPGATSAVYQTPVLSESTFYRLKVSAGTQTAYTAWLNVAVARGPNELDYYTRDSGLNYIVTCAPMEPVQYIGELGKADQQRSSSVTYFDGLGRPVQTVLPLHTPEGKDLVSAVSYDAAGREHQQYLPLPVAGGSTPGAYVANTALQTARHTQYGIDAARAFTETRYEASPLNRVTQQIMPGTAWEEHPVSTSYQSNASPLNSWQVKDANGAYETISYGANQLYVTEIADPNGHPTRKYKDKQGKVVMTEQQDGSQWLQTHYVYDDLNLLRAVLPPQAGSITDSAYCYYYRYDPRHRMIEKKLPGAGWQYMVYDHRDRVIYSQDANQRAARQWLHYVYDELNREIRQELCIHTAVYTRDALQTLGSTATFSQRRTLSETYYDGYQPVPASLAFAGNNLVSGYASNNKGRVTMQRTAVLDAVSGNPADTYLATVFYYDDYGWVVQSVSINHLGGIDRVSTKYDFRGNPLETYQESSWLNSDDEPDSINLRQTFVYDALKRPTAVKLSINGGTEVTLSQTEYDELLRVSGKSLHGGKENIAYSYNIQNWLTKIESALFTEELYYHTLPSGATVSPQYNGNIAAMSWRHGEQGTHHKYAFTYDGVNRLTGSQYAASGSWGNPYTEQLTYDKNGNIQSLQRYGAANLIENLVYAHHGNQVATATDLLRNPSVPYLFVYDANGNMQTDGIISSINYNLLNLPQQVNLTGSRQMNNTYAADGRKLASSVYEGTVLQSGGTKKYNGNLVFDHNTDLEYILMPEGRITKNNGSFTFEYHLKDHLGSTRVAFIPTTGGKDVVQKNAYYPFGATIAELSNSGTSDNRYKREGKEYVDDFDWNKYDYIARTFDPWGVHSLQLDPMAEKYYHISPYSLFANNPFNYIDPDGRKVKSWYVQKNIGGGLGYGLYAVKQYGRAKDDYGKTRYKVSSYAHFNNQNLEEGSTKKKFVAGADAGVSAGYYVNWNRNSMVDVFKDETLSLGLKSGFGIGGSDNSFSVNFGAQVGLTLNIMEMTVEHSLSLTYSEANLVENWDVQSFYAVKDKDGNIIGYTGAVTTKDNKTIIVESGVTTDKNGNTVSDNIWVSVEYKKLMEGYR